MGPNYRIFNFLQYFIPNICFPWNSCTMVECIAGKNQTKKKISKNKIKV